MQSIIYEINTESSAENHSNCDATQGIVSSIFNMQCQSPNNMVMWHLLSARRTHEYRPQSH
jgi:hypothetical protein